MSVVGFQDFWVAGTTVHYQRTGSSVLIDLGVIQSIAPNVTAEKIELYDPRTGVKQLADSVVTKISESYNVTVSNLSLRNLSLLFLGNEPTAVSQSARDVLLESHAGTPEEMLKLHDDDASETPIFGLRAIMAVAKVSTGFTTPAQTVASINKATGTIVFSADVSASISAGDRFYLLTNGSLADFANATTYEAASVATTTVTLTAESAARISSTETGLTTNVRVEGASGDLYLPETDWEIDSLPRATIRFLAGGAFTVAANVYVSFSTAALSGIRTFTPQAAQEVKGKAWMYWSRNNNADQTVREIPSMTISPNAFNLSADDYSTMVLTMTVQSDVTQSASAGRVYHIQGSVPAKS